MRHPSRKQWDAPTPRMIAIRYIETERSRQIESEGWSAEHDDEHRDGEMMAAAIAYYMHAKMGSDPTVLREDGAPLGWPWEAKWWKPKGPVRDLERAGALVRAERERLLRRSSATYVGHCDQKFNMIVDALASALMAPAVPQDQQTGGGE